MLTETPLEAAESQTDSDRLRAQIRALLASPGLASEVARDLHVPQPLGRDPTIAMCRPPVMLVQLARLGREIPKPSRPRVLL
ncbi:MULTISPECIES: hypothetical protein [Dinoroseobacter]|jgi:hypothetical protein|uniref:hypothetical protein n=1 Tax=Dinoroseobacter TaxID=309512 RepID=UPI0002FD12FE|nr:MULTISPECIES: hypothetical protein [Dinoroseobacter]MDD9715753.1 hypothetical protein [Dinoroseobacter sp. PD6]URF48080.1 hypothetical protein M8008_07290 [Dinoroseobacter shibae]URF52390.1 hypothetical protein M8007_07290 [Dinoroseobacter shibae]